MNPRRKIRVKKNDFFIQVDQRFTLVSMKYRWFTIYSHMTETAQGINFLVTRKGKKRLPAFSQFNDQILLIYLFAHCRFRVCWCLEIRCVGELRDLGNFTISDMTAPDCSPFLVIFLIISKKLCKSQGESLFIVGHFRLKIMWWLVFCWKFLHCGQINDQRLFAILGFWGKMESCKINNKQMVLEGKNSVEGKYFSFLIYLSPKLIFFLIAWAWDSWFLHLLLTTLFFFFLYVV